MSKRIPLIFYLTFYLKKKDLKSKNSHFKSVSHLYEAGEQPYFLTL